MNLRKSLFIGLNVCLTASLLACSSGNGQQAAKEEISKDSSQKKVTLRLGMSAGATDAPMYDSIVDDFQKKYPNIKIEKEYTPTLPAHYDKLAIQLAGNDAPDIISSQPERAGDFADRNQLLPLDEFIKTKLIDVSDFNEKTVAAGKANDKNFLLPIGSSSKGFIYNADLFKRLNVEPLRFDSTWDEFAAKGAEVIKASNKPGFYFVDDPSGSPDQFGFFVRQKGRDLYTTDRKLGFTKEDMIEWLQYWAKLRKDGIIPPASVSAEYKGKTQAETALIKGITAASVNAGGANQLGFYQVFIKDRLELIRIPSITGGKPGEDIGGIFFGIYAKSKHPKEAAEFINYWINDPDAVKLFKEITGPSASKKATELVRPLLPEANAKVAQFQEKVNPLINLPITRPANSGEVFKSFGVAAEAVAFGKKSIEQAVNDFFNEANKILQ
jgi:multiple sugar transport system substrate-binding protein